MEILLAIVVTAVILSIWQSLATRKIRANQALMVGALLSDLEDMAEGLGHSDYLSYLRATKGDQYAEIASANLVSFTQSFTARGAD
jgi:hypothetical protein